MYILYLEGWGTLCSCNGVRLGVTCVSAGNFVNLLRVLCLIVNNVNLLVKLDKAQLFLVVGEHYCYCFTFSTVKEFLGILLK